MGEGSSFALVQFLPYQLNMLADKASCELSRIYHEDFGISVPQWRVLVWLQAEEDVTAQFIADATRMDKTKTSRAIAGLVDRGYVLREADQRDLRQNRLRLTEQGDALLAVLLPLAQAWENQWLEVLSEDEQQQFNNLLSRLEARLGTII
ncbi:MarR family winged helix-turn-helix transcriptional regulator [Suttonella sp. R2A3]|uniref:MarR family winged helix-turn-helix transcriptional regulator n=1 Tax=Suttonella sp. R2A3 TaxID=2908648 RepID=UPI001F1F8E3D|nr:MarR family winged helix-turn-helix transcriptional regulator [Suttonella sp. R2A3]UJF24218.1 MarR family winged helix-turn-helix transcriptional regulator [Suttonella sp. R2A3]